MQVSCAVCRSLICLEFFGSDIASDILLAVLAGFAITVLRVMLYRVANKRMPGTWMLFVAIPGFISLLYSVLSKPTLAAWLAIVVAVAYYLLVFAISLGLLAGFERWKAPGSFRAEAGALFQKFRKRTQNDVIE